MKLLKGIKIGANISIKVLTNLYGVFADVYFPKNDKSLQHGFYDDNIEYSEIPDFSGKLLIPSFYSLGETTLPGIFDNLTQDEPVLYLPNTKKFPKYSLIVVNPQTGVLKFRINDEVEYKDDESTVFRKYILVPVITTKETDFNLIEEKELEFDDEEFSSLDFEKEYSIVKNEEETPNNNNYKPIKAL